MARTLANATPAERRAVAARIRGKAKKKKDDPKEPEKPSSLDPISLDDEQLLKALKELGANVGPINDSTRALYQRRLGKLMKEKEIENLEHIGIKNEELNNGEEENKEGNNHKKKEKSRNQVQTKKKRMVEHPTITEMSEVDEDENDQRENSTKKRRGRPRKVIMESEDEVEKDGSIPVQSQLQKMPDDERRDGRKTKDKKVSFAPVDRGERKWIDEEEKADEDIPPVKILNKKGRSSVRIATVRRKEDEKEEEEEAKIPDQRSINRTVVIEESEEEEEPKGINKTLGSTSYAMVDIEEEEEEEGRTEIINEETDHIPIRRQLRREEEEEEEMERKEDEGEITKEDGSNSTIVFEGDNEEEEIEPIPNEGKEEEEERIDYGEEVEKDDNSSFYNRSPVRRRLMITVDTPVEEHVRRSRYDRRMEESRVETREDEEDERRRTIDIFNTRPRASHRTTMDIFRGRTSLNDERKERKEWMPTPPPPRRDVSQESENMDISGDSADDTTNEQKNFHPRDTTDDAHFSIYRNFSRRLFLDESDVRDNCGPCDANDESRDGRVKRIVHSLIMDTPKSSKLKSNEMKKNEGPRNIRNIMEEEREGGMSSHDGIHPKMIWERDDIPNGFHEDHSEFPMENTKRRSGFLLDHTVGMDTFYHGIGRDEKNRMNSTRTSEANALNRKTFVVRKKKKVEAEDEKKNDATFDVLPKRLQEKRGVNRESPRANLPLPSPSTSPSTNPRKTFVIRRSPSRLAKKSSIDPSSSHHILPLPPKPMPRRMRENQPEAPPPSIPPVPAPRRRFLPPSIDENGVGGKKMDEKEKKKEISPVSLFNTQPRVRMEEELRREYTPEDKIKIEKLKFLRQSMRELKQEGKSTRNMDDEAREIVENDIHLKRFFY